MVGTIGLRGLWILSVPSFVQSVKLTVKDSPSSQFAQRYFISGRVQGVFYRASTREQALRLGITGYAKNLADGRVEVVAYGARESLAELQAWLWRGPMAAEVREVQVSTLDSYSVPPSGFSVE